MQSLQMNMLGLDHEAMEALHNEAQVHLQKIAEIGQKCPGTWDYELQDEAQRHRRYLERIFLGAKSRYQSRA
jgi:hypothetical protein